MSFQHFLAVATVIFSIGLAGCSGGQKEVTSVNLITDNFTDNPGAACATGEVATSLPDCSSMPDEPIVTDNGYVAGEQATVQLGIHLDRLTKGNGLALATGFQPTSIAGVTSVTGLYLYGSSNVSPGQWWFSAMITAVGTVAGNVFTPVAKTVKTGYVYCDGYNWQNVNRADNMTVTINSVTSVTLSNVGVFASAPMACWYAYLQTDGTFGVAEYNGPEVQENQGVVTRYIADTVYPNNLTQVTIYGQLCNTWDPTLNAGAGAIPNTDITSLGAVSDPTNDRWVLSAYTVSGLNCVEKYSFADGSGPITNNTFPDAVTYLAPTAVTGTLIHLIDVDPVTTNESYAYEFTFNTDWSVTQGVDNRSASKQ